MTILCDRFLHTGYPLSIIATAANCAVWRIREAQKEWVTKWQEVATPLTRQIWLGEYPEVFKQMQPAPRRSSSSNNNDSGNVAGADVAQEDDDFDFHFVSLDSKVFPCESSRIANFLDRSLYSSKTESSGFQTLVWSMPCGTPFLVTGLFGAKCSEKHQVAMHSGWLTAVPKGVSVLADRGFRMLQRYYPKSVLESLDFASLCCRQHHTCRMCNSKNTPVIPAACKWVKLLLYL